MPSIERVSVTQYVPFGFSGWRDEVTHGGRSYTLHFNRTDADYFAAAGVRLLHGRTFTAEDVADERPVAIISESVARAFFQGIDPLGQQVSRVPGEDARQVSATIVGVVSDAMTSWLRTEQFGAVYLPLERKRSNTPGLVVRTASPGIASRAVEEALRRIDPRVRVTTAIVAERVDTYLGQKRMLAWLAGPTAILALVLAMLGLYGVTAFAVSHRAPEMSLRIAIGATSADVLRLVGTRWLAAGDDRPGHRPRRRARRQPGVRLPSRRDQSLRSAGDWRSHHHALFKRHDRGARPCPAGRKDRSRNDPAPIGVRAGSDPGLTPAR